MAMTEPKAISMMMMAARIPTASLAPGLACTALSMGAPPSCTLNPGAAWARAVSTTLVAASLGRSTVSVSNCTTA